MPKPELGTKRVCVACGAKFYDLQKDPAVCPACGTEQPAEAPRVRRGAGNVVEEKRVKKPVPGADADDIEVDAVEDEAEEDVLEDISDLEDDADPLVVEIEVETESDDKDT